MGKQDEAVAELEKGVHFSKDQHVRESAALSRLGYMYGITGQRNRAEVILAELQRMSIRKHLPATDFCGGLDRPRR